MPLLTFVFGTNKSSMPAAVEHSRLMDVHVLTVNPECSVSVLSSQGQVVQPVLSAPHVAIPP